MIRGYDDSHSDSVLLSTSEQIPNRPQPVTTPTTVHGQLPCSYGSDHRPRSGFTHPRPAHPPPLPSPILHRRPQGQSASLGGVVLGRPRANATCSADRCGTARQAGRGHSDASVLDNDQAEGLGGWRTRVQACTPAEVHKDRARDVMGVPCEDVEAWVVRARDEDGPDTHRHQAVGRDPSSREAPVGGAGAEGGYPSQRCAADFGGAPWRGA